MAHKKEKLKRFSSYKKRVSTSAKNRLSQKALLATFIVLTLFVLVTRYALAAGPDVLSCVKNPFSCAVLGISWLIQSILNLFVMLFFWLAKLALQFNEGVQNSPAVQSGFSVTSSVANLGFVMGIIVIALATILRRETYGIKQILWKLVFAAILVNFSLVICGVILNFSDSFTKYFIKTASPSGDFVGFTNALVTAFAPQSLLQPPVGADSVANEPLPDCAKDPKSTGCSSWQIWKYQTGVFLGGAAKDVAGLFTSDWRNFLQTVLAAVFTIVFSLLMVITAAALAVLLLIRYVYISILLIIAPLAWLMWVFPHFSDLFSKWWNNFLRWAFFPPLTMFFVYLALITASHRTDYLLARSAPGSGTNQAETALVSATNLNPNVLASAAQMVVVLGLLLGGLFAANKLSIKGADVAMGVAKGGGKAFGGWVAKTGARGALLGAAKIVGPKPGAPPTRVGAARIKIQQKLQQAATYPALKTKPGVSGLASTVWQGMKKGSGLFKGAAVNDWECQVCNNMVRSRKKPTGPCQQCGSPAAKANWTQV